MSDRDVRIYLQSGPSRSKEEETNEAILNKWEYAANLQKEYGKYMSNALRAGVSVLDAHEKWNAIVDANPYVIRDDKKGTVTPNPTWLKGITGNVTKDSAALEVTNAVRKSESMPKGSTPTGRTVGGKAAYKVPGTTKLWVEP